MRKYITKGVYRWKTIFFFFFYSTSGTLSSVRYAHSQCAHRARLNRMATRVLRYYTRISRFCALCKIVFFFLFLSLMYTYICAWVLIFPSSRAFFLFFDCPCAVSTRVLYDTCTRHAVWLSIRQPPRGPRALWTRPTDGCNVFLNYFPLHPPTTPIKKLCFLV